MALEVLSRTFEEFWECHEIQALDTSNSRPWRSIGSFMYIGSAGPGPGGRTGGRKGGRRADGRADGRTGGQTEGADGRKGCFERQYNDFHRFSTIFDNFQRFSTFFFDFQRFSMFFNDFQRFLTIFDAILRKSCTFKSVNVDPYIRF